MSDTDGIQAEIVRPRASGTPPWIRTLPCHGCGEMIGEEPYVIDWVGIADPERPRTTLVAVHYHVRCHAG